MQNHEVFYVVQAGDSLSGIARKMGRDLDTLIECNPHIKDPDLIHPNDIVALGFPSRSPVAPPVSQADLQEMQSVLRSTSPDTLQIAQKAFDVLDYLSHGKDGADFLNSLGDQTAGLIAAAKPYSVAVSHSEMLSLSSVYSEIYEVRRNGISFLQRYQLSVTRTPVLVLSVRQNGFYPYAEQLKKVLKVADKIKLGKFLTIADAGIEVGKVALVASQQGAEAGGRQGIKGAGKVFGGMGGVFAAKSVCTVTLAFGPWGIAACGLALGIGIWGGQAAGEELGGLLGEVVLPSIP